MGWGKPIQQRKDRPTLTAVPFDPFKSPEGTPEEKRAFATALLKTPDDPRAAAQNVFGPERISHLDSVARLWPRDAEVVAAMEALLEEFGDDAFLPTKAELMRDVYSLAKKPNATTGEALAAFRLYGELGGHIVKQAPAVVNNNNSVNTTRQVLIVKNHGTLEEWQAKLQMQQAKLINADKS